MYKYNMLYTHSLNQRVFAPEPHNIKYHPINADNSLEIVFPQNMPLSVSTYSPLSLRSIIPSSKSLSLNRIYSP
jgi:hypothetical protein